jgi:hypothetical protein
MSVESPFVSTRSSIWKQDYKKNDYISNRGGARSPVAGDEGCKGQLFLC